MTCWQITGAIVLPIIGLAGDFFLTKVWIHAPWIYGMGWLIGAAALLASARATPGGRAQDVCVGAMAACAVAAAVIGVTLLSDSAFLLFFLGVGLLGFAPLCLAAALASRVHLLWRGGRTLPFAAVGAGILLLVLPAQALEWSWVDRQLGVLKSDDPVVVENALRTLNDYPLNFGRFAIPACWSLVIYASIDYHSYPGLAHEVGRMLGPNPADCETGDPHS